MEEDNTTDAENLAELTEVVAKLGDVVAELNLGGPDDGHVCEIAAAHLRQAVEMRDKAIDLGQKLIDAKLVDPAIGTPEGFDFLDGVISRYRELEAERDTLRNQLDEQELKAADAALKAANAAKAGPIKRPDKKIAVAPIKLKSKEKPLDADGLLELISAAETVEVSFSDGEHEIASLGRRAIMGSAWVKSMGGLKLQVPEFAIYGPARGEGEVALDGYGLMLDNELVAYAKRSDPLKLRPNGQYDLKDDVIFG